MIKINTKEMSHNDRIKLSILSYNVLEGDSGFYGIRSKEQDDLINKNPKLLNIDQGKYGPIKVVQHKPQLTTATYNWEVTAPSQNGAQTEKYNLAQLREPYENEPKLPQGSRVYSTRNSGDSGTYRGHYNGKKFIWALKSAPDDESPELVSDQHELDEQPTEHGMAVYGGRYAIDTFPLKGDSEYNLIREDLILDFLMQCIPILDINILCLQEVSDRMAAKIGSMLGDVWEYKHHASDVFTAIRRSILKDSNNTDWWGAHHERTQYVIFETTENLRVYLVNTHGLGKRPEVSMQSILANEKYGVDAFCDLWIIAGDFNGSPEDLSVLPILTGVITGAHGIDWIGYKALRHVGWKFRLEDDTMIKGIRSARFRGDAVKICEFTRIVQEGDANKILNVPKIEQFTRIPHVITEQAKQDLMNLSDHLPLFLRINCRKTRKNMNYQLVQIKNTSYVVKLAQKYTECKDPNRVTHLLHNLKLS